MRIKKFYAMIWFIELCCKRYEDRHTNLRVNYILQKHSYSTLVYKANKNVSD